MVLSLDNRRTTDRQDLTFENVRATFGGVIPFSLYVAISGRGSLRSDDVTTEADEDANKRDVLRSLDSRLHALQLGGLGPSGILDFGIWRVTREDFVAACKARGISIEFLTTEFPDYDSPPSAGSLGCVSSHFAMIATMVHQNLECLLVLENDCKITPAQGLLLVKVMARLNNSKKVIGKCWDMVMLRSGGMGPSGGPLGVPRVALPPLGKEPALHFASHVAGTVAYCIHHRAAIKILASGLHKGLFCFDDFLNCVNANRRSAGHLNPRLQSLPSVQHVLDKGGLHILSCAPSLFTATYACGDVSDTRYHIAKVGPLSVGGASRR